MITTIKKGRTLKFIIKHRQNDFKTLLAELGVYSL